MKNYLFSILLLGLFIPIYSWSFRMSPMVVYFTPEKSKATQVLTLENSTSEKVPVQVEALTRDLDKNGDEVRSKTDDFIIYPDQLVLLPGEKRNVRVTWSGTLTDGREQTYRIVASQLPVDFPSKKKTDKQGVQLNFLLQYVASAYVTPSGAKPQIKVKSIKMAGKKLAVVVSNEGTAHKILRPKKLVLVKGAKPAVEIKELSIIDGFNLLAKKEKEFLIPFGKELPLDGVTAELILLESSD